MMIAAHSPLWLHHKLTHIGINIYITMWYVNQCIDKILCKRIFCSYHREISSKICPVCHANQCVLSRFDNSEQMTARLASRRTTIKPLRSCYLLSIFLSVTAITKRVFTMTDELDNEEAELMSYDSIILCTPSRRTNWNEKYLTVWNNIKMIDS